MKKIHVIIKDLPERIGTIFSTEENEGLAKNLTFAMVSQGVGLLSSVLMSLVVPKVLGVEEYAFWQLFMLYATYSGLALLGVNDGIYLKLGGQRYYELNKSELKSQIAVVTIFQLVVGAICLALICSADIDAGRRFVFIFVVIYGLVANLTSCLRYVFQSTNLTQLSSLADLIARVPYLICVVCIVASGGSVAGPFIIFYTICQALGLAYIAICARSILKAKNDWTCAFKDCLSDIRSGIKITISYYADQLIVGITRMMVDWRFGLSAFGKLSFSFSMTNFVLIFIGQVSMVIFPVLKRLSKENQKRKYLQLRVALNIILPFAYLLYVPLRVVLGLWLPQYGESLLYLALTMPLCIYSCKANFLFNTYLKMGRREGVLCRANVLTTLVNAFLSAVAIYVFGSIEWAAVGIVVSVAFRDFAFERYMAKNLGLPYLRAWMSEMLLSACFMTVSWVLGLWSWPAVAGLLAVYIVVNRQDSKETIALLKMKMHK